MSAVLFTASRPIPLKRYRLGAEELIEMGDSRRAPRADRRPFLGNGARISMGAEELIEMGQPVPVAAAPAAFDMGPVLLVVAVAAGIAVLAIAL